MSYIVTADHPFYPEVHYAKNQFEAEAIKKEIVDSLFAEHGTYDCVITIARVVYTTEIKCNY